MSDSRVKLLIHVSDIHARNMRRHDEYKEVLTLFIEKCKEIINENGCSADEVRICILGDLVHQKIQISNELQVLMGWFLKELDSIATTLIIAGNHDLVVSNKERLDSLTPLFSLIDFERTSYVDLLTDYKSGVIEDENIMWVLFSIFDDYKKPNIENLKEENPDKTFIGLFHGPIIGSSTDIGYIMDKGIDPNIFNECDFVLCGDIHKRQTLKVNDVDIVYSGSLIQQDYGENISKHGFILWDLDKKTHTPIDIQNEYGFYKFRINKIEDIENNKEVLINR